MLQEICYKQSMYQKAGHFMDFGVEQAWLSTEQEHKLKSVIDFLEERGYTYRDRLSRWGSMHGVYAKIVDANGKEYNLGFREQCLSLWWSGSLLFRIAEGQGKYAHEQGDRYWQPGQPGYPTYDNFYFDCWQREECRRLDREDQALRGCLQALGKG